MSEEIKKKILVADDEASTLTYLCRILERENYEVIPTTRGKEAVELTLSHHPDLVILDIVMPDLDGGEVAALISNNPHTAGTPIIFLTGILTKDEESYAGTTGKRHVLAKPVTRERLLEMIIKVLSE
ncbi:MAG: response regulator [Candidatus Omnitrophota bacterium]